MGINALPKVVYFDAAGTLIHLPKGVGWHYVEVARRWGIDLQLATVEAAFRRAWKQMPTLAETRVRRIDDGKGWWRDLVKATFAECDVPSQLWSDDFFDDLYSHFGGPGVWDLFDDVLPVLNSLRGITRLGIISNWDGRLRSVLSHLGIGEWFDPVIISSEHGAEKPSAYLFQQALDIGGIRAGEALHVGDDPLCDWQGARDAGFAVFELNRARNSLRDLYQQIGA